MRDYRFLPYEAEKPLLMARDMRKRLPDVHLALFIGDVVDTLDIAEITTKYRHLEGGQPAYHPAMMLKLLFYVTAWGSAAIATGSQKKREVVTE
ncbi:MAG: hypothetical protein AB1646_00470 [Thermodesulfobacteriota bacterium]